MDRFTTNLTAALVKNIFLIKNDFIIKCSQEHISKRTVVILG